MEHQDQGWQSSWNRQSDRKNASSFTACLFLSTCFFKYKCSYFKCNTYLIDAANIPVQICDKFVLILVCDVFTWPTRCSKWCQVSHTPTRILITWGFDGDKATKAWALLRYWAVKQQWWGLVKRIRSRSLDVKYISSNSHTRSQLSYLAALCWPPPPSWKMSHIAASLTKVVKKWNIVDSGPTSNLKWNTYCGSFCCNDQRVVSWAILYRVRPYKPQLQAF